MKKRGKARTARRMPKGRFTNLDKVFWPKEGFTKGDVIRYYDRVAEYILPYLRDRPMVLARHPNGIRSMSFFQKHVGTMHLPPFVKTVSIRAKSTGRNVKYIVCNNKQTLLFLANLGCIEMHPWNARTANVHRPDFLSLDLDPGGNPYNEVVKVARAARKVIEAAGGTCLVKTSGKTGIHVLVPLKASYDFAEVRGVARTLGQLVHRKLPRLTTTKPNAGRRTGKVYLDYVRNSVGQTLAAPYSLRACPGATVSTPLAWNELTQSLRPARFALRTIFRRLNKKGDIWRFAFRRKVSLRPFARRLDRMKEEGSLERRSRKRAGRKR